MIDPNCESRMLGGKFFSSLHRSHLSFLVNSLTLGLGAGVLAFGILKRDLLRAFVSGTFLEQFVPGGFSPIMNLGLSCLVAGGVTFVSTLCANFVTSRRQVASARRALISGRDAHTSPYTQYLKGEVDKLPLCSDLQHDIENLCSVVRKAEGAERTRYEARNRLRDKFAEVQALRLFAKTSRRSMIRFSAERSMIEQVADLENALEGAREILETKNCFYGEQVEVNLQALQKEHSSSALGFGRPRAGHLLRALRPALTSAFLVPIVSGAGGLAVSVFRSLPFEEWTAPFLQRITSLAGVVTKALSDGLTYLSTSIWTHIPTRQKLAWENLKLNLTAPDVVHIDTGPRPSLWPSAQKDPIRVPLGEIVMEGYKDPPTLRGRIADFGEFAVPTLKLELTPPTEIMNPVSDPFVGMGMAPPLQLQLLDSPQSADEIVLEPPQIYNGEWGEAALPKLCA